MRTCKLSALSFSILGTLCLSAPVFAAGYSITGLGTLGGSTSYAYGINSSGQIVGESDIAGNTASHAFIYANGVMTDLGTPIGATGSYAVGINNNGQISGNSYSSSGGVYTNNRAFLYSNGQMTSLGTLGGDSSYILGNGINNNGQVVGMTWTSSSTIPTGFLYSNGQMTATTGLSQASAINDSGQVAGTAANGHIALWNNGVVTDLGTLGGQNGWVGAINASGQIAGSSYITGGSNWHAFLYSNGGMIDLGAQVGMNSDAYGINTSGTVVGDFQVIPGGQFPSSSSFHAFVYNNGVMTDLNTLLAGNSGWTLYSATGINDSGQIVGFGSFNGQDQAFVLNPTAAPVPVPAAVWLLGSGLLGLFGIARKRKAV